MSSKILMQLQDFLCQPEVTALYSSIHKLHHSKLEEALRIRGLSRNGDESTLRIRLLRFEVQFYHPEIQIPCHGGHKKITKEEAVNLQMRVDALCDMTRMLRAESTDATPNDAGAEQATVDTDESKTSTNTNDRSHKGSNTENQVKHRLNCVKLLKVCNLQYTGTKGLTAQNFLENLDDFRKFSKISERVLLETLACVLDIDTKKWYRANNFTNWQSFEQKFIDDYVRIEEKAKQTQIIDRAAQTDEVKNDRVVMPITKKSAVVRMPVSRTLQDLKDSLSDIGFKTADCTVTSKKSNSEVKVPVQSRIDTPKQAANVNKAMDGCSSLKSNVPTANVSISESLNVIFRNNSTFATTAGDRIDSKFSHLRQSIDTISSQSNAGSFDNIVSSNEIPTIAVSPAMQNLTNSVVVKSQAVVSQNNTTAHYTNPISSPQPINNNVVTSVSQGQIAYRQKPADSRTLSSTNATSNGGCYLYARHDCNAPNLGQEYLTSQAFNYGYGTYHYPMDYYMPNGFGHC